MSASRRKLSVTMPVTGVHHCPGDFDSVCCLNCEMHLGLTQPESEEPARLIGTCGECGRWYLLDWHPSFREGLMVLLPDHADLLKIFASLRITKTQAESNDDDESASCEG